jgi:hypothetical protein
MSSLFLCVKSAELVYNRTPRQRAGATSNPGEDAVQVRGAQVLPGDLGEGVAEVGRHLQVAPLVQLLGHQARPVASHNVSSRVSADLIQPFGC